MAHFDTLLANATEEGNATVHGAIFKCIDKNGKEIYSKIAGLDSLSPTAQALREDAVLKAASSTKLFTSIALLQCIERGQLALDHPLGQIAPELGGTNLQIITGFSPPDDTGEPKFRPATKCITARHLLAHTSGLGYWFLHPLLMKWATTTPQGKKSRESLLVHERHAIPLIFEPGEGWMYGVGVDWAGVIVRRLNGGVSLEEYMVENIWKPLGLTEPFPTFCISRADGTYRKRLMGAAERTRSEVKDGGEGKGGRPGLREYEFWQGDNTEDQDGGHGLVLTTRDFLAVLADLVADEPKLLRKETVAEMFTSQLEPGGQAAKMLVQLRVAWDMVAGPVAEDAVNHGLGGMLVTEECPETGQPGGILAWGGAANTVWWACRDKGVAGFMSTQLHPFGDECVKELVNAWRKDFWSGFKG